MIRYLTLGEFAIRAELSPNTMKGYLKKGMLPEEDARVGNNRGWLDSTVDAWIANRHP
jgi:predicted DNA-binding transcriptional regulator AlpA